MVFEASSSYSLSDTMSCGEAAASSGPGRAVGIDEVVAFNADTGVPADVPVGMNLLAALEVASQETVAIGCRNGGCGVCRVRILSGSYIKGKMSRKYVTVEDEHARIALACRVYPTSALIYRHEPLDR